MLEKELSVTGWNWGCPEFRSVTICFEVRNHTAFEIPLKNVSQCTIGKNEFTLQFHQVGVQQCSIFACNISCIYNICTSKLQNDKALVSLMEMLLFIQSNEQGGDDAVAFQEQVMLKTGVIISVQLVMLLPS